jgi:putative phage-type endonuclease
MEKNNIEINRNNELMMNNVTDSEYSDSTSESESCESVTTKESISFIDSLQENEIYDLQSTITQMMDEYLDTIELLKIAKPDFHKKMIDEITNTMYYTLLDSNICKEECFEELYEFVDSLSEMSYDINSIPHRSEEHSEKHLTKEKINILQEKIEILINIKQPPQKSKEWYEFRHNLISASNIYKVFGSDSKRNELIYEKCKPVECVDYSSSYVNTESPLHWGNKYEPLTVMMYEKKYNTKIMDFGCIPHPKYSFIGASPDGINNELNSPLYGRMVEIKNIVNREIDGIPSEAYWTQMQIQMETCDLDECDFIETRFKQYANSSEFWEDTNPDRGIILYFVRRDSTPCPPLYKYMPLDIELNQDALDNWVFNTQNELKDEWILFETHYWYLDEFSCVLVKRNKKWFEMALPKIEETWNTILEERVNGYEHRLPKKRIKTEVLEDENGKHIKNFPTTNTFCLIKLDS